MLFKKPTVNSASFLFKSYFCSKELHNLLHTIGFLCAAGKHELQVLKHIVSMTSFLTNACTENTCLVMAVFSSVRCLENSSNFLRPDWTSSKSLQSLHLSDRKEDCLESQGKFSMQPSSKGKKSRRFESPFCLVTKPFFRCNFRR